MAGLYSSDAGRDKGAKGCHGRVTPGPFVYRLHVMAQAAILAQLKGNKGTVRSEYMEEEAAQQELARITEELNLSSGDAFIKLGKSATVNREEVLSVELVHPPYVG
jgi:hypothetical protein